ncbi:two-component regulator propeller domain-containing protein [uncultured Fibrella sp.]|uniref:two-component regulator propeller domain-containing protein n=1 Tax=uncultured Fibrella sp. TaxID=1284596 RepID=UPI0035CBD254
MNWLLTSCLYLLVVGLTATTGLAQREPDQFRFEHITVNEGLSHSDAMCVVQDKDGFIWVGTNNGINRYDGHTLKKYLLPVNTRNGLSGNRISALHTDSQGRLWVGSESSGLSLFDASHDRFINVSQLAANSVPKPLSDQLNLTDVNTITSDNQGRIWAGTSKMGLFVLTLNAAAQVVNMQQITLAGRANYRVTELVASRDGTVWIGTSQVGLWYAKSPVNSVQPPVFQHVSLPDRVIRALHIDYRGDLWIGTNEHIFWVSQKNHQLRRELGATRLPQPIQAIECIYLDSFGKLWVGTNFGLHVWPKQTTTGGGTIPPVSTDQPGTFLPLDDDPYSINSGRIHQIFEDRTHILWLAASAGGLNKVDLRHKPFDNLQRQFSQHPTLPNNYINAIYKDETRNWLWIGTRNGFSRYDLATRTYRNYVSRQLPGDATGIDIASFCQASDGTLWVGTRYEGIIRLQGDKLTSFTELPGQPTLLSTSIESIVEDRFGTIWAASFEIGLLRFDRQGKLLKRFSTSNSGLLTKQFTFLLYDKTSDILWASTKDRGVLKLRVTPDSLLVLNQYSYNPKDVNSLSVNYAWPLLKDRRGGLWIGTIGGGLNQLTTDKQGRDVIRRYGNLIPEPNVESILEDEEGQLWLGGEGLVRFNPTTGKWLRYDLADGLQSNSFKVGAAYRATDGTLYFGGIKGLTYFKPSQIRPNPYPPVVRLTNLRIYNKPVAVGETVNGRVVLAQPLDKTPKLVIKAAENDFSVEFVGLNYANPQKHTYAYQLQGYNDSWVYATAGQRTASFANLPAGDYTLVVKASNGEGQWSSRLATLAISVLPPWWRTWWAYLIYIALIGAALVLYRRVALAQQALKNKLALEQFKVEKEKEVTDSKLRFFTNVSHELRTPLTLILGPMDELASAGTGQLQNIREKIMLMHQQTRKLMMLVNQLMDFRKVEAGHITLRASRVNITSFLTEIVLIFKLKAEELNLDYAMEGTAHDVMMYIDRSKVEIVLTNLLSNAIKYTPTGRKIRVLVSVAGSPDQEAVFRENRLVANYVQITVRDWGVGMKADEVERVFDPYYQASHTETMRMMGTGIGLSLVKQFVEAHSGEVTVQSAVGAGTTFTLRLPFGRAHLPTDAIHTDAPMPELLPEIMTGFAGIDPIGNPALPGTYLEGARILLVEDNDELRPYLQQLFEPAFTVYTAADGIEGWDKTLELMPDLVVSDVMMPRSSGLDLCRKIKQNPKTMHLPVVLLTARVSAIHELEGLETGADEYMAKPFNPRLLYAKIVAILQSRFRQKEYYHRQILLEPTDVVIPDEEKQLLEKAMGIVEANLNEADFTVPVLVREMGMSQSAFYRQIKAITGQSAVEFIRDVRMKRAAQLLATSHLRIAEIAHQVGFEDLKHFRKTFQNLYGMSPSDYARQHREATVRIE